MYPSLFLVIHYLNLYGKQKSTMTLITVQTKVPSVIFYLEQINTASHILYVAFSLVNSFLLLILQKEG